MEQELDLQYHVHAALDVVEEKCLIGKGAPESKELYLGLLYSTENHKMYQHSITSNCIFITKRCILLQLWFCDQHPGKVHSGH